MSYTECLRMYFKTNYVTLMVHVSRQISLYRTILMLFFRQYLIDRFQNLQNAAARQSKPTATATTTDPTMSNSAFGRRYTGY